MLDCFDGLISLDGTCSAGTGLMSLQTLDGMSETLLKDITGPEDTVASMVAQCENWARVNMHNDVLTHLANRIIGRTFVDRKLIGDPDEEQTIMSDTGIGGILVEIDQPRSNAVMRLGSLGLFANFTGDVTITIYDLEDGSTAATYVLSVVAGESISEDVQIALPAHRKRKAYFITHDLTSFYRVWTREGGCSSCSGSGYEYGGVRINGARLATGLSKKKSNLRLTSDTSGLSVLVTVECDHAQLLCEVRNTLAFAYLNKVGEALMRRGILAFGRMNSTRLNLEQLEKSASVYGATYSGQMDKLLKNMRIPDDKMCFTCNSSTKTVISIP